MTTDRKKSICSKTSDFRIYRGEKSHLNSLWSIWYGLFGTVFQTYVAIRCTKRLLKYGTIHWVETHPIVLSEFHMNLMLTGIATLVFPLFFVCTIFKIGNHANDGLKLAREPIGKFLDSEPRAQKWILERLWRHCGPVAPLLHMITALCFLIPKLLIEARLTDAGYLTIDTIWKTDVDFLIGNRDHLMVLSFLHTPINTSNVYKLSTNHSGLIATPNYTRPMHMAFSMVQMLKEVIGNDHSAILENNWPHFFSLEYLNYAIALLVYSLRYPSVFWYTSKRFGLMFSSQLLVNVVQHLLLFSGVSIVYKIQLIGLDRALPTFQVRAVSGVFSMLGRTRSPFMLTPYATIVWFVASFCTFVVSSWVFYFYGYTRLNLYTNREQDCKMITMRSTSTYTTMVYCCAILVILIIGTMNLPLMYDFMVVYEGTQDSIILLTIILSITYLLILIIVWLHLMLKQKWRFKLGVLVNRQDVTTVKLMTGTQTSKNLLVLGDSWTNRTNKEQVYWLHSNGEPSEHGRTHKVAFEELPGTSYGKNGKYKALLGHDDDGDYATLREVPRVAMVDVGDDSASEEGKLLACIQDETVTYARTSGDLDPPRGYSTQKKSDIYQDRASLITGSTSQQPNAPTPRCLRRADSGMPQDELTPRSDSISTSGSSPPEHAESNHSESSSGVHSNASSDPRQKSGVNTSQPTQQSMTNTNQHMDEIDTYACSANQMRLLKNQAPAVQAVAQPTHYSIYSSSQYINTAEKCDSHPRPLSETGLSGIQPTQSTVVIRRAPQPIKIIDKPTLKEINFGRATNMKMISFRDELRNTQASSVTLPHYPTQQTIEENETYPHCSTMPHIQHTTPVKLGGGSSYGAFPRQHTTIPTELNGVRLYPGVVQYGRKVPFLNQRVVHTRNSCL